MHNVQLFYTFTKNLYSATLIKNIGRSRVKRVYRVPWTPSTLYLLAVCLHGAVYCVLAYRTR